MKGERFSSHRAGFVQGAAGADNAWKIRKRNAVVAIGIFMDEGDVLPRMGMLLQRRAALALFSHFIFVI